MIWSSNGRASWPRSALDGVGAVLLVSGAAWLAVHYSIGAGAGELPNPAEAWLMRLHGLAAFAGLFLLGAVLAAHVPAGWRSSANAGRSRQRASGLILCTLGAILILTGYLLYYFAPEPLRPTIGWIHAGAGAGMAMLLGFHRRGLGIRSARRARGSLDGRGA